MKKATEKVEPTFEDILRKNIHDGNGDCVIHQYENSDGVNFEIHPVDAPEKKVFFNVNGNTIKQIYADEYKDTDS
jgi:hypothetical protein